MFQTWNSMIFQTIYSNFVAKTIFKHLYFENQWVCKCIQTESIDCKWMNMHCSQSVRLKERNYGRKLWKISDLLGETLLNTSLFSLERISPFHFLFKSMFCKLKIGCKVQNLTVTNQHSTHELMHVLLKWSSLFAIFSNEISLQIIIW